jgi:hypothetical protein
MLALTLSAKGSFVKSLCGAAKLAALEHYCGDLTQADYLAGAGFSA